MPISSENLKNRSDDELAELQRTHSGLNPEHVLIEQEWQRRARDKQHELNMELLRNQHELNLEILNKQLESQTKFTKLSIHTWHVVRCINRSYGNTCSKGMSMKEQS